MRCILENTNLVFSEIQTLVGCTLATCSSYVAYAYAWSSVADVLPSAGGRRRLASGAGGTCTICPFAPLLESIDYVAT